jgi:hypothetical protein
MSSHHGFRKVIEERMPWLFRFEIRGALSAPERCPSLIGLIIDDSNKL